MLDQVAINQPSYFMAVASVGSRLATINDCQVATVTTGARRLLNCYLRLARLSESYGRRWYFSSDC